MLVRPLSTVDNIRDYARVSHSRQWSNCNFNLTFTRVHLTVAWEMQFTKTHTHRQFHRQSISRSSRSTSTEINIANKEEKSSTSLATAKVVLHHLRLSAKLTKILQRRQRWRQIVSISSNCSCSGIEVIVINSRTFSSTLQALSYQAYIQHKALSTSVRKKIIKTWYKRALYQSYTATTWTERRWRAADVNQAHSSGETGENNQILITRMGVVDQ